MSLIGEIQKKIAGEQFEFSKHAVDQSIARRINVQEVREAVAAAEPTIHGDAQLFDAVARLWRASPTSDL